MIDFSKLKGLSIPEGAVKQIADAAGKVLWSAAKPMVTITLPISGRVNASLAYLMIDGMMYTNYSYATRTLEVPVGTIVECWVCTESKNEAARVNLYDINTYITSRLFTQNTRDVWGTYYHTVTTNTHIITSYDEDSKDDRYGIITITGQ